jgi:acetyl-CoA C-acetyltransferase
MGVVVLGVGFCGAYPASAGHSYRELTARAARMAYDEAGVAAERIDGAVVAEEDFISGYSITDEYSPDQLGMARKPVYTVGGDFLQALGSAVMQIRTGRYRILVVSAYSKASNMLTRDEVLGFAFDPTYNRFGISPHYLAGIEMQSFLGCSDYGLADVAHVVERNRRRAALDPLSPFGGIVDAAQVLAGRPVATPVTDLMIARPADAAVVAVIATDEVDAETERPPVYIAGTGWASATPVIEHRDHGTSVGTALAAQAAYAEAHVEDPADEIDAFFVSDLYAHRQLMHMSALGIGQAELTRVNPDGGSLGMGDLYEANGGARFYSAIRQLRGDAGANQVEGAERVLVHGWRGLPTDSCAVVILDGEGRGS